MKEIDKARNAKNLGQSRIWGRVLQIIKIFLCPKSPPPRPPPLIQEYKNRTVKIWEQRLHKGSIKKNDGLFLRSKGLASKEK